MRMRQKALFEYLNAPLRNYRWSWGAVRASNGTVFLRVWEDRKRPHAGSEFVMVTHRSKYRDKQSNPAFREREDHIRLVQNGAASYLVFCQAVATEAEPRKIKSFNSSAVFPGGRMVELDGEMWIEVLPGLPIDQAARGGAHP